MYDKSLRFLVTHDMEIKLPEIFFDSATFKLSPKYYEGNGLVAKLEIVPNIPTNIQTTETPRIFFKKISKSILFIQPTFLLLAFIHNPSVWSTGYG